MQPLRGSEGQLERLSLVDEFVSQRPRGETTEAASPTEKLYLSSLTLNIRIIQLCFYKMHQKTAVSSVDTSSLFGYTAAILHLLSNSQQISLFLFPAVTKIHVQFIGNT